VRVLIDTNVFVRMIRTTASDADPARSAVETLSRRGDEPCVVPQVLYEFWAVATRPKAQNGLGCSVESAVVHIAEIRQISTLLRDALDLVERWQSIVVRHEAKGKQAHDARLIAAIQAHDVNHIMTFNAKDFRRYSGLSVLTPGDVHD
jgi:predicted nucleic acid-binding protein